MTTNNHSACRSVFKKLLLRAFVFLVLGAQQSWVVLYNSPSVGMITLSFACPVGTVTNLNTTFTYSTIQAAIDDPLTLNGHHIQASAGLYNEDVTVYKQLWIEGAGYATTTVSGPIGGGNSTFAVTAPNVIIEGFTITRDGNNPAQWNLALNTAGVSVQSTPNVAEIRFNKFTGNRTAIDINNSNGNNIHNNIIDNNRIGLNFRNQTNNTNMQENFITNNWTVGVLFLDGSGGTNVPLQQALNSTFRYNDISGNWYGQVVDRQSGGALPPPGTNSKNFNCNWYGTVTPVTSTANSTEPGYAAQIPVIYGGAAVPPGGQPDILGPASANIVYQPFLINGTDNSIPTMGFQPVPGSCLGALPLHFTGFNVKDKGCSGLISCTTADEQNVKNFEVQQSFDGNTFTTVKTVASQGNGSHNYEIEVNQPQKRMYYRVVAVDIDNRKSYGVVLVLQLSNCTKAAIVQVYPIPAYRDQKVTMQANVNDKITYSLIDISGKVVQTGIFIRTKQLSVINSGTYLLEMTSASFKETQTIIVQ